MIMYRTEPMLFDFMTRSGIFANVTSKRRSPVIQRLAFAHNLSTQSDVSGKPVSIVAWAIGPLAVIVDIHRPAPPMAQVVICFDSG
jgi:hypothetical protein